MTAQSPEPFIDPAAIDSARDFMREALARLPANARVALCNALLGVILRSLVAEAGRVYAGCLLRAAAADAGAILQLQKRRRPSRWQRFLEGYAWGLTGGVAALCLVGALGLL